MLTVSIKDVDAQQSLPTTFRSLLTLLPVIAFSHYCTCFTLYTMAPLTSSLVVLTSLLTIVTSSPILSSRGIDARGDYPPVSSKFQETLEKDNKKLYSYPTDFTQGIFPRPLHSHNDCKYQIECAGSENACAFIRVR